MTINDIFIYFLVNASPYLIVLLGLLYEFASLYIRLRILIWGWSKIWNFFFNS
jgi:hypothetical protein